nr:MAG TPA: hypothetical protein [Caudoviricetes sp.]
MAHIRYDIYIIRDKRNGLTNKLVFLRIDVLNVYSFYYVITSMLGN